MVTLLRDCSGSTTAVAHFLYLNCTSRISDEKVDQGFFNVNKVVLHKYLANVHFEDISFSRKSFRDLLHLYVLLLICIFSND